MTEERKNEERVEDLDVPESESEDVKGGLLPAIQGQKFHKFHKFHKVDVGLKIDPGASQLGDGSV